MNKLDLTKPMQLTDGTPVRLLCSDLKHTSGFILLFAYLPSGANNEQLFRTNLDGKSSAGPSAFFEVENVHNKTSEFINVYEDTEQGLHWDTLEQARNAAELLSNNSVVKILEYTFENEILVDIKVHNPE